MKLAIKDIKPNPFKKYINDGKLDEERVKKIMESIEHGTLPETFNTRKSEAGEYELCFGHHRIEALKRKKGKDYEVSVEIVKYSDETMLIDMVRENLTHRDSDFRDTEDSIVLARNWLESGATRAEQFVTAIKQMRDKKGKFEPSPDSARNIAKFISKQGKTISHDTVQNYLNIHDKLAPELHDKVGRLESATNEKGEGKIPVSRATALTTIESQSDQKILNKLIDKNKLNKKESRQAIREFKKSPESVKGLVRKGDIPLTEVQNYDEEGAIVKNHFKAGGKDVAKLMKEPQEFKAHLTGKIDDLCSDLALLQTSLQLKVFSKGDLRSMQRKLKQLQENVVGIGVKLEEFFEGDDE